MEDNPKSKLMRSGGNVLKALGTFGGPEGVWPGPSEEQLADILETNRTSVDGLMEIANTAFGFDDQ